MKLVFISSVDKVDQWRESLTALLPDLEFAVWPDEVGPGDLETFDYALVWKPPSGILKQCTNLKAILSLGAGVDGVLVDPELPTDIPICRLVDRCLTQGMTEYILYYVIHYHRRMAEYAALAASREWRTLPQEDARRRRIGIMGLGELGADAASKLMALDYDVACWSRSAKSMNGIDSYHGENGLYAFLARTQILICLLPLTEQTRGIINADTLAKLPKGAAVINCARGGHVIDDDLLAALDSGHIAGATLDVFNEEPLPAAHPYWDHPNVIVTPHMASLTVPHSAAEYVAENIRRIERGEAPLNIVDLGNGY